jgi:hypothetical protein
MGLCQQCHAYTTQPHKIPVSLIVFLFFQLGLSGVLLTHNYPTFMMKFSEYVSLLEMEKFRHTPLNHEQSSIRLVQILPQLSSDGLLQCEITQHVLPSNLAIECDSSYLGDYDERCEPYICLSYVWGGSQDGYNIKVDGKYFRVRANLGDFMWHARKTLFHTYLWIEALCIDQTNTRERNHQVQRMGSIYSMAQTVLIWLGNDRRTKNVLRAVNETSGMHRRDLLPPTWQEQYEQFYRGATGSGDESSYKALDLVRKLSENCYWSRAWVSTSFMYLITKVLILIYV